MRKFLAVSLFTTIFQKLTWFHVLILAAIIILIAANGPEIVSDTGTYESYQATRQPLYPFILNLFKDRYDILIFLQVFLGVLSIFYLVKVFFQLFDLTLLMALTLYAVLFIPFLPIWMGIGNLIATEALSYALFLTTIALFVSGLHDDDDHDVHKFIASFVVLSLLLLLRKQFLFVYPVYFVLLILGRNKRKTLLLIGALICSFLVAFAGERLYHGIYHGHYQGTPFTGMQLIAMPLYTTPSKNNVELTDQEQRIVDAVQKRLEQGQLNCENVSRPIQCGYHHYSASYNSIVWVTLRPILVEAGIVDWFEIDSLTTSIALKLLKANLFTNVKFYLSALHNSVGTYYFLFLVIVLGWSMIKSILIRDTVSQTILLITALNLANIFLILLVEPLLHRYTFYTSLLQIAGLVALLSHKGRPLVCVGLPEN